MINFLIIDDEKNIRKTLTGVLEDEGYAVITASDGPAGLKALDTNRIDIVLLDIWLPDMGGMDVLKEIRNGYPAVLVIMISGHGTVNLAVDAIKNGAFDFIEKPLSIDRLLLVINKALKMRKLEQENYSLKNKMKKNYTMIGKSPALIKIKGIIQNTAATNGRVLITGENGTGKEMIAKNIHIMSDRSGKPFIEVNCAAIPENLIESELFGHEKGSFTGAINTRVGKFELANQGTIFLDEIADMSLQTQAKVLRVLQEMEFERVGSIKTILVDVRVITATNKKLKNEIRNGNFREDLYYRLNVIPIHIPPLRERKEDIPPLIDYFTDYFCVLNNKKEKSFTKRALSIFLKNDWPGNIRELRNMIERIVIMVPDSLIDAEHILSFFTDKKISPAKEDKKEYQNLKEARDDFEREYIHKKLIENSMNVSKTALSLGIERSNLHRKINNLKIRVVKT